LPVQHFVLVVHTDSAECRCEQQACLAQCQFETVIAPYYVYHLWKLRKTLWLITEIDNAPPHRKARCISYNEKSGPKTEADDLRFVNLAKSSAWFKLPRCCSDASREYNRFDTPATKMSRLDQKRNSMI